MSIQAMPVRAFFLLSSFLALVFSTSSAFAELTAPNLSVSGNYTISWNFSSSFQYQALKIDGQFHSSTTRTGSKSFSGRSNGNYAHTAEGCNFGHRGSSHCVEIGRATVRVVRTSSKPISVPDVFIDSFSATSDYELAWDPVEYTEHYQWVRRKNGGSWTANANTHDVSVAFDDPNATYDYKVRACNANGCTSYSTPATIIVDEPPATPPAKVGTLTLPSNSHSGQYVLSWEPVAYAERYEWSRKINNGSWGQPNSTQQTSESFDDTPGSFEYRVRACNGFGCGSYSNTKSITVVATGGAPEFDYDLNNTSMLPSLPNAMEVTLTAGTSSISQGNLTYDVPIQTPPAVNGLKPSLSLQYNSSNRKSGLAGLGWNISGIGAITRCRSVFANEGMQAQKSNPLYSKGDRLCLNGLKLELVGNSGNASDSSYWTASAEYRTETETFNKVKAYGSHQGGPAYFKVWKKNGNIEYYGSDTNNQNSQIFATGRPNGPISRWQLSKVEDRYGNFYTVHYSRNTSAGEFYPSFIFYEPGASIVFQYKDRDTDVDLPDIPTHYDRGHLAKTFKILERVETFTSTTRSNPTAGPKVFEYLVTHKRSNTTGRYLVEQVQQCGFENSVKKCAEPLTFNWSEGSLAFSRDVPEIKDCSGRKINLAPGGFADSGIVMEDIDQDGLNDLIGPTLVYWGTNSGCFEKSDIQIGGNSGHKVINTPEGKALLTQTLGYGRSTSGQFTLNSTAVVSILFKGRQPTSFTFDSYVHPATIQHNEEVFVPKLHVADFNNDGLEDFEFHGKRRLQKNNGRYEFGPIISTSRTNHDVRESFSYVDSNGDGVVDIYAAKADFEGNAPYTKWAKVKPADFNGDGLSDALLGFFVVNKNGETHIDGRKIFTNTGEQMVEFGTFTDIGTAHDFNRDGLTDYVSNGIWLAQYGANGLEFVKASYQSIYNNNILSGSTLSPEARSSNGLNDPNGLPLKDTDFIGDLNNDGLEDSRERYADRAPQDFMKSVVDGLGREELFEFDTMNGDISQGKAFYTPSTNISFPSVHANRGRYLIKSYAVSNGLGDYDVTYYHYYGAKDNVQGRGFVGFSKIEMTHPELGLITTTEYHQDFPFATYMKSNLVKSIDGKLISRSENSYKVHPQNNRFVYLASQYSQQFELTTSSKSSDLSTTATRYEYDQYGSVTESVRNQGRGVRWNTSEQRWEVTDVAKTVTTSNRYINNVSDYLIGFLERTERTSNAQGETKTVLHSFEPEPNTIDTKKVRQFVDTNIEKQAVTNRNSDGVVTSISERAKKPNGTWTDFRVTTHTNFAESIYPRNIENAKNHSTQLKYDFRFGKVRETTDPNGLVVTTQHDAFGRAVEVIDQVTGSVSKTFSFYCEGSQIFCPDRAAYASGTLLENSSEGQKLGAPLSIVFFDELHREVRTQKYTVGGIIKLDTEYDVVGRVKRRSLPFTGGTADNWIEYTEYDALGRPLSVEYPDGSVRNQSYSQSSGELIITNENHVVSDNGNSIQTTLTYKDSLGQIRRVVDSHMVPIDYTYDAHGNLKTTTVNNNIATRVSITHDLAGNKIYLNDPDAGPINFEYNGFGELLAQIWRKGSSSQKSMIFDYDLLGRVISRNDRSSNGSTKVNLWTWDTRKLGLLSQKTSDNGFTENYIYDSKSRIQSVQTNLSGLGLRTFTYGYDGFGRERNVTYPDGLKIRRDYHALGENTATFDITGRSASTTNDNHAIWQLGDQIDALGNTTQRRLGNGVISQFSFDLETGRASQILSGKGQANNIQALSYTYDSAGNLLSRQSQRTNNSGSPIENLLENFQYDGLNRLINTNIWGDPQSPCGNNVCYDDLGNITYKTGKGVFAYSNTGNAGIHAITSGNGLNYQYDKYGNISRRGNTTVEHDVFNKPTVIGHVTFAYGPDHKRWKQHNSSFGFSTYYFNGGLYEETTNGIKRSTVDGILVRETRAGVTDLSYLLGDNMGSVETITDSAGNILDRLSFDAWGERRGDDWSGGDPTMGLPQMFKTSRGYTGHEHLDDLGLIHMNGRVYDPTVSRFMEADIFVSDPYNTQTFSRYSYVRNNPLKFTDPSGYRECNCGWSVASFDSDDDIPETIVYPPPPPPEETGNDRANRHRQEAAIQRLLYAALQEQSQNAYFTDLDGKKWVIKPEKDSKRGGFDAKEFAKGFKAFFEDLDRVEEHYKALSGALGEEKKKEAMAADLAITAAVGAYQLNATIEIDGKTVSVRDEFHEKIMESFSNNISFAAGRSAAQATVGMMTVTAIRKAFGLKFLSKKTFVGAAIVWTGTTGSIVGISSFGRGLVLYDQGVSNPVDILIGSSVGKL